jgi:hypothetical protein
MLATIAAQDLINILENIKDSLAKKKAFGIKFGILTESQVIV